VLAKIRHTLAWYLTEPVVRPLSRTRLSPNTLTILGFLLSLAVAYLLATGHLFLGGFLVFLYGWFDLLDGALARSTGRTTSFGALLDSTLDRVSEAALLFGLLIFYINQGSLQGPLLLFAVLIGSLLVSYVRARAEGLGLECQVGLFTRAERIVLLALGLILGATWGNALLVILWVLAVGTFLTAIRRLCHVRQRTRKGE
jgi:CDP-diacylglycerol--glycerol-3-phosphate 3-phosphatidyltransferase